MLYIPITEFAPEFNVLFLIFMTMSWNRYSIKSNLCTYPKFFSSKHLVMENVAATVIILPLANPWRMCSCQTCRGVWRQVEAVDLGLGASSISIHSDCDFDSLLLLGTLLSNCLRFLAVTSVTTLYLLSFHPCLMFLFFSLSVLGVAPFSKILRKICHLFYIQGDLCWDSVIIPTNACLSQQMLESSWLSCSFSFSFLLLRIEKK